MPTMTRAAESTANQLSGHNVRDVDTTLHYLEPDAAPLTAFMTQGMKKKYAAKNPQFEWQEKGIVPKADQAAATAVTAATTITVDNAAYFGVFDIVRAVPTGEVFRVTAVDTSTDVLTISRAVGSTTAAQIADNADLLIIGNARAEGADKGNPRSYQETVPFNYTQIFQHEFGETGTQSATQSYVDGRAGAKTRLRREKAWEHRVDKERAFLFGERNRDTTDTNNPLNFTGGLLYWATSNNKNMGGAMSEAEIEDSLEDVFTYASGSNTRILLASPKIISVLDQLAAGRIQTVSDRKATYGIGVKTWVTGHGELVIVKHHLLTDGAGGAGYGGYGFLVDPSKISYVYMNGRDTKLETNTETNGADRWEELYRSECGIAVHNPEHAGIWTGVTG